MSRNLGKKKKSKTSSIKEHLPQSKIRTTRITKMIRSTMSNTNKKTKSSSNKTSTISHMNKNRRNLQKNLDLF